MNVPRKGPATRAEGVVHLTHWPRGWGLHQRADAIRKRIEPTVVKRAPQLMVKVTGGGRGMLAIAAHFRYISKNGRLGMENELGERPQGRSEPPRGG